MVILISGASHTGKTALAQKLLDRYRYPVLSLDLLKMGLIRSGQTSLTPEDDELLTPYLWNIVKDIVKTAIENEQNLIVEGCYIPFDWEQSFAPEYLSEIEFYCLIMTKNYLENHEGDILRFANIAERRLHDEVCIEDLVKENENALTACRELELPYCLIDDAYHIGERVLVELSDSDFHAAAKLFCETVHAINTGDYSPEQLDAWAPCDKEHRNRIARKLASQYVAGLKECGILIGFGSLGDDGDIDTIYVHKDRQGQGVARSIVDALERVAAKRGQESVSLFSSITAKPFFEHRGYTVEYENSAVRNGVRMPNYRMRKNFTKHSQ